jgi:hypothetical protein
MSIVEVIKEFIDWNLLLGSDDDSNDDTNNKVSYLVDDDNDNYDLFRLSVCVLTCSIGTSWETRTLDPVSVFISKHWLLIIKDIFIYMCDDQTSSCYKYQIRTNS